MGHYRSEMGWETYNKETEVREEKRMQEREHLIQKLIDEKGIARVLAEAEVSTGSRRLTWPGIH